MVLIRLIVLRKDKKHFCAFRSGSKILLVHRLVVFWQSGSALGSINAVTIRQARLGWMTILDI